MATEQQIGVVLNALTNTLNHDDVVRKPAEELLRSNETQTGFASTLVEAMVAPNADPQTRLLAAIYLKNNIIRYWRGVVAVRISAKEKDHLRPRILQLFSTMEPAAAVHIAPAITKMFISDEPEQNPTTLQQLLQPLIGAQQLTPQIFRALAVFKPIVKQWCCLFGFQFKAHEKIALFKQSAESIVGLVLPIWRMCVEQVIQTRVNHPIEMINNLKVSTAVLRDLLSGHAQFECTEAVVDEVFEALKALAQLCLSQPPEAISSQLISACQGQGKLMQQVQKKYPQIFVGHDGSKLGNFLLYILEQLTLGLQLPRDQQRNALSILVPCATLLCSLLLCSTYRQNTGQRVGPWEAKRRIERRSEDQKALAIAVETVIGSVMTPERVTGLCSVLIANGLQLAPSDLEDWKSDPESFALGCTQPSSVEGDDDYKEQWKRSDALRLATCAVLRSETKVALPVVLELYNSASSVLLKDACLHAVGLALENKGLGEEVNLSDWISGTLGPEFSKENAPAEQVVLHRRIIWLVGRATEVISNELREQFCYMMVTKVAQPTTDPVVRLTAAASLASLMEAIAEAPICRDLENETDPTPLVRTLLELFSSVDSDVLRGDLLKAVCGMMRVYRARSRTRKRKEMPGWDTPWPAGDIALQSIGPLMQAVGDSAPLKAIVIDVMAELILCRIGGEVSIPLAVQLIDPCITLVDTNGDGLLLREAAQRLWRDLLTQHPPLEHVMCLFPRAVTLLEHDHGVQLGEREVPILIQILTDYFVIGDTQFCVRHAPEALQSVLSYVSSEEHSSQLRVALVRHINVLAAVLGGTEEFVNIMGPLYVMVFFNSSGGVAALWDSASSRYEVAYSLARVSMKYPHNLIKLFQWILVQCGAGDVHSFKKVVFHWLEAISKVSAPGVRLIVVCGISALFTLEEPVMGEMFAEMVGVVTKLLNTALKPMELQRRGWQEVHSEPRAERERKLLLCGVDEIADQVPGLVMTRLRQCADRVGHGLFQQLVAKLPAELQQQLHGLSAQFTPPQSPQLSAQVSTPKLITSPTMPPSPLPRAVGLHPAANGTALPNHFQL
eukprot:TRINITY_DN6232_c0_g1_i4.p1 TRINITY_DN6232_c0_g1~~TRINITY_DN6232_c0_g1_i4.p1  ORF type:complete len:1068 (-),score=214.69 TRINITY_DN6232_c0_g1_i4:135-3338(-)